MTNRSSAGFTLIELAIVIAIIGILAAVAVPKFTDLTSTAQKSVAQSLLQSLQSSIAIYVANEGKPPTIFSDFVVKTGSADAPHTLTLENMQEQITNVAGDDTQEMVLTFEGGATATYKLNETDIIASYAGF